MKIKTLHSWFSLPELGYWLSGICWYQHHDPRTSDEKNIEAMQYAIDNWITHFDAAEIYWCGHAEKILWELIKNNNRAELQISSKVKGSNCSYEAIKIACKKSLERLGIDYLDLYYIHWRDKQFDLKDCMKALDELVDEWLIKNIGVSNFSVESLKEATSYTQNKIVANQVHYNLIFRECEKWLLEYCQKNDVLLVAYRPLELWKLANYGWSDAINIWMQYNKTQAEISLNFLTSQENVVTIFTSTDKQHIKENLWCLWWKLNSDDMATLKKENKKIIYVSDCIPLG